MLGKIARLSRAQILWLWAGLFIAYLLGAFMLMTFAPEPDADDPFSSLLAEPKFDGEPVSPAARDSIVALYFSLLRAAAAGTLPDITDVGAHSQLTSAQEDTLWQLLDVPSTLSASQRDSLEMLTDSLVSTVAGPIAGALNDMIKTVTPWILAIIAIAALPAIALILVSVIWIRSRRNQTVLPADS